MLFKSKCSQPNLLNDDYLIIEKIPKIVFRDDSRSISFSHLVIATHKGALISSEDYYLYLILLKKEE